ncbi:MULTISPECIES: hypothetical protein [unclassified Bradyrhizobium]|uniref:hypothetical protein n=1 Tax=unclassified Bradyrhizobium TaxID=2631580 RepID=UPI002916B647|nr:MULTISPECIES: hypothetical protein [unclassified Bradyrhizobium]
MNKQGAIFDIEREGGDIRQMLRSRLETATAARKRASQLLGELDAEVSALQRLLRLEEMRHGALEEPKDKEELPLVKPAEEQQGERPDLSEFLRGALEKYVMLSKPRLRRMAHEAGYDIDGRSIHATLTNLIRVGKVVQTPDGMYTAQNSAQTS